MLLMRQNLSVAKTSLTHISTQYVVTSKGAQAYFHTMCAINKATCTGLGCVVVLWIAWLHSSCRMCSCMMPRLLRQSSLCSIYITVKVLVLAVCDSYGLSASWGRAGLNPDPQCTFCTHCSIPLAARLQPNELRSGERHAHVRKSCTNATAWCISASQRCRGIRGNGNPQWQHSPLRTYVRCTCTE